MIEVLPCGVIAITKIGNIRAEITAVEISYSKVVYKLTYFDTEFKVVWMDESQFDVSQQERTKIGFKLSACQ